MRSGIIFDIKRFAVHDGPGIRTTIFLKGCPLNCIWCHNPEGISSDLQNIKSQTKIGQRIFYSYKIIGKEVSTDIVVDEILKDKIFYDESKGGVTFSGGEPLCQIDFLYELLTKCKEYNLHTTVDTCGYASLKDLKQIVSLTDLFLYDLKIINDKMHKKCTGVSNKIILSNLEYLIMKKAKVIVRIPIIPSINDQAENINDVIDYLQKVKFKSTIELLPFHNAADNKYKNLEIKNITENIEKNKNKNLQKILLMFSEAGFVIKKR